MGRTAPKSKASLAAEPVTLTSGSEGDVIRVRGARQHNLKNVDLTIPRNKMVGHVQTLISTKNNSHRIKKTLT